MKKHRKTEETRRLVLDIVSCSLSVVTLGLSIAAFVISLAKKKER